MRRRFVAEGRDKFGSFVSRLVAALNREIGRAEEDRGAKMATIEEKFAAYRMDKEKEWDKQKVREGGLVVCRCCMNSPALR